MSKNIVKSNLIKEGGKMFKKVFCKRIKNKRLELGLTQKDLALRLGITRSYVSMIESGDKIPSRVQILALANIFGCSVIDLDPHFDFEIEKGNISFL